MERTASACYRAADLLQEVMMSASWVKVSQSIVHLDSIIVLVPFLFPGSPRGVTIDHVAESACKDHESEYQGYKRWHNKFLYCCILNTLLAHNRYALTRGDCGAYKRNVA